MNIKQPHAIIQKICITFVKTLDIYVRYYSIKNVNIYKILLLSQEQISNITKK